MKSTRQWAIFSPIEGASLKSVFKAQATDRNSILYGYRRFTMPRGKKPTPLQMAKDIVASQACPEKHFRRGECFVFILENKDFFFFVDLEVSPPVEPLPVYEVLLESEGVTYRFEVGTSNEDAEEYALAELYKLCGESARNARVVVVKTINHKGSYSVTYTGEV